MFRLKLGKGCISCGICMDICPPKAINMRIHIGRTLEGSALANLDLNGFSNGECTPEPMMTFPYMAHPVLCDGCMVCVKECPTGAIDIIFRDGIDEQSQKEAAYEQRTE